MFFRNLRSQRQHSGDAFSARILLFSTVFAVSSPKVQRLPNRFSTSSFQENRCMALRTYSETCGSSLAIIGFVLGAFFFAVWPAGFANAMPCDDTVSVASSPQLAVSPDIDTDWRYTKFGWQNAANWVNPNTYVPRQTIQLLHPLVWAGIVLISVLATMIWASSEWELARLFQLDDTPLPRDDSPNRD
jgi:hypothetical protein